MTSEQIEFIRTARGANVSWHIIARRLGSTLQECRAAIGMPVYDKPAQRQPMPWDVTQQSLPFGQ
ncbi:MAG: hypothetical protein WKF77_02325 [Planctomycetaceae bacterium]